jgi:uncharacterized integral membrane protein
MSILRYFTWLVRLLLFVVLLLFALKNTAPVRLQFFLDAGWDVPLVVLLLVFFAAGAAVGVMACLGGLIRQRRRIGALARELEDRHVVARQAAVMPPDSGL